MWKVSPRRSDALSFSFKNITAIAVLAENKMDDDNQLVPVVCHQTYNP